VIEDFISFENVRIWFCLDIHLQLDEVAKGSTQATVYLILEWMYFTVP
jgi:hypothetical protein